MRGRNVSCPQVVRLPEVMRMAYRIVYGPEPKKRTNPPLGQLRIQVLTAVFLLIFVLAVKYGWPEGTAALQRVLLPGEPSVTQQALEGMVSDLQEGEPLGEAFTAFCQQIIDDGKAAD